MAEAAPTPADQIVYLEPDDEIPSVIRRVHASGGGRVILVAAGRTKALSSVIALRLLARTAAADGMEIALVADSATRAVAAEAGVAGFPTVTDAQGGGPAPALPARPRASIRVVRGDRPTARVHAGPAAAFLPQAGPGSDRARTAAPVEPARPHREPITRPSAGDETLVVPIAAPIASRVGKAARTRPAGRGPRLTAWRTLGRSTLLAIAGTIAVLAAAVAAVIPGATVHLTPRTSATGPFEYRLSAAAHSDAGQLDVTATGTATGKHVDSTPAKGTVTFSNYNAVTVLVPVGTQVSAGKEVFASDGEVSVPPGVFTKRGIVPGTNSVAVTATHDSLGPDGNVAAGRIDTIDDEQVAANLGGPFRIRKDLVVNPEPLAGGSSTTSPEVTQMDVDAAREDLQSEAGGMLEALIAGHSDRVYVSPGTVEQVTATIPEGLVGTRGQQTFDLSATLVYARTYALRTDLQAAAATAMHADAKTIPAGRMLIDTSVTLVAHDVSTAGGQVVAHCSVSGKTAPAIDTQALKSQIAGLSAQEADARLDALGTPRIDFWPGWVTGIPRIGFRVEIVIEAPRTS